MTSRRPVLSSKSAPFHLSLIVLLLAAALFVWAAFPAGTAEARVQKAATSSTDGGTSEESAGDQDWFGASESMLYLDSELAHGMVNLLATGSTAEMFLEYPAKDDLTAFTSKTTKKITLPDDGNGGYAQNWGSRNFSSANGRIADPLHDGLAFAWYTADGTVRVETRRADDGSLSVLKATHLNGTTTLQRAVDLAVGDLDKAVDGDNYYHDEIAVCRTANVLGSAVNVQADVLDYNFNTLATVNIAGPLGASAVTGASAVACDMGDFDGDHQYELAVAAYWYDSLTWKVYIYKLVQDATTLKYSLNQIATQSGTVMSNGKNSPPNPMDIAAGDFANTGKDQLILGLGQVWYNTTDEYMSSALWLLEIDAAGALQTKTEFKYFKSASPNTYYFRLAAGVFKYDPENGWDLNRRQLALTMDTTSIGPWSTMNWESQDWLYLFEVDTSYNISVRNSIVIYPSTTQEALNHLSRDLDITAGNFIGHGVNGDQNSPTEQAAVIFSWLNSNKNLVTQQLMTFYFDPSPGSGKYTQKWSTSYSTSYPGIPFIHALDYDGDSWRLGTPTRITMNQMPKLDSIVQEPPKHVEYLPVKAGELTGAWDTTYIGAYTTFQVSMKDSESQGLNTTTKSNSSYDIGGAASVDFKACLGMAKSCDKDPAIDASLKLGIQGKYQSSEETINTWFYETTMTYNSATTLDDNLTGKFQIVDVWRYPILGYQSAPPDSIQGFYEVVIPGTQTSFTGGGFDHADWYQPQHENHNILSYPPLHMFNGTSDWSPTDLGSFTIPDPDKPDDPTARKTVTQVMNWQGNQMTIYTWDGNDLTIDLNFSKDSGTSTDKEHESTMSESLDIKFGIHLNVRVDGVKVGELGIDMAGNFDSKQTWGGGSIGETTDSVSKGITIEKPAGENADKGYAFATAVYAADDGTFKVSHATDAKGSTQGASYYQKQYGPKTDPALNLPYRFEWHEPDGDHLHEWWTMRELDDEYRKRMRGFFMRYNTPDPVSGDYELLDSSPVDGDVVQLCARVYNYSFLDTPVFKARFYYLPWNTQIDKQSGDPVSQANMVVDVSKLDSVLTAGGTTMREVCVPWDTKGLSSAAMAYRFVVRLDEERAVDELHESWDSAGNEIPGGNNEGYWPWSDGIVVFNSSVQTQAATSVPFANITFANEALGIKIKDKLLSSGTIHPALGKHHRIRMHFASDRDERRHRIALLYDQDPDKGGKAIASRVIYGFNKGDNYRWIDWTPKVKGDHDLYVRFLDPLGDASRNVTTSMHVIVVEDTSGGGCTCSAVDISESPVPERYAGLALLAGLAAAAAVLMRRRTREER